MAALTTRQVGNLARALGHDQIAIFQRPPSTRWIIECSCGYGAPQVDGRPSVTRATFAEAVSTGQHHLRSSVRVYLADLRANGRVLPPEMARAL